MGWEQNAKPDYNEIGEVASFLKTKEGGARREARPSDTLSAPGEVGPVLLKDPWIIQPILQTFERPRVAGVWVAGE